jgi:hypothetical protein
MYIHHTEAIVQILFQLPTLQKVYLTPLKNKTNSLAFGLKANYTDWATATGWRNLVPTLVDRGVSCGQHGRSPMVINLSFLDWSRYFFFQVAPHLSSWGWVDPVPDPLLRRTFGSAGNRSQDLWVSSQKLWPLDHRGGPSQKQSTAINVHVCVATSEITLCQFGLRVCDQLRQGVFDSPVYHFAWITMETGQVSKMLYF